MPMDALASSILANTYTVSDLYRRFAVLQEFSEYANYNRRLAEDREVSGELRDFLTRKELDSRQIEALLKWGEEVWRAVVSGGAIGSLSDLSEDFDKLPVVVLYVPTKLLAEELDRLGAWLRRQTGESILLDVRESPKVAGGCAFSWRGVYYDYSFASRLSSKRHQQVVAMVSGRNEAGGSEEEEEEGEGE